MGIRIALAGNPNCGKTTLFNALTGSNQFVGNWPGVTVEKKEGRMKGKDDVIITDLPGIYSLSPYTLEEVVARKYLIDERPDAILNIVDGTNLERNLYLTTQLTELGIPVVIAINMMDIVEKNGDKIDTEYLSRRLGCPIFEISALKSSGIEEAADAAIAAADNGKTIPLHNFSGAVEHAIAHIEEAVIHDMEPNMQRWYAIKIFERDSRVIEKLGISKEMLSHIEGDIKLAERELDDDAESIITNDRYNYITGITKKCYKRANEGGLTLSDKIDRIVTNRFLALPIFALVIFLVYYISVSTVGAWVTDFMNEGVFGDGVTLFGKFIPGVPVFAEKGLDAINCAEWLKGLVIEGIVGGVGSVLGFVPQMLVLFFFLAFLEACGYMSRIAFVMDRIFRKFGLSGKSFIPLLVGTGCSVPGIMASRTIENERDRRMTIMTTSFIPCGAKIPIIGLIASDLFGNAWWVAPSAYFLGIAAVVVSGLILKKTKLFSGDPSPFVMELPPYHMPTFVNILRSMWERGWSFIKKAGTVILLACIVIWAFSAFGVVDGRFMFDSEMPLENSVIGIIGGAISWIFAPLGFGYIETAVASLMGLLAKEEIVGVLEVLNFNSLTQLSAYSFLMFNLLCAPCIAAMGAIRREMNSGRWTAFAIGYQCTLAYCVSLMFYQFGLALSGSLNTPGFIAATAVLLIVVFLLIRKPYDPKKKENE